MRHALLKYWTARSCFSAAARVEKVPRFLRRPVFGFFFLEYSLYCPDFSLRIMATLRCRVAQSGFCVRQTLAASLRRLNRIICRTFYRTIFCRTI
jgi:hypothetical protein